MTITPLGMEWIDEHWGLASLQPVDLGDFAMSSEDLLSPFTDRGAVVKSPTDPPTRKDLGPITSGPSGQLDLVRSVPLGLEKRLEGTASVFGNESSQVIFVPGPHRDRLRASRR